jgi:Glycosyl transferase family 2
MTASETLILGTYFFVLVILAVYGWHRYYLVYLYMKNKGKQPVPAGPLGALPPVTIQLPIYNEMYVADRLIDAVCRLEYPRELLEIQVLDDSTDETRSVAEQAVRRNAARGIDITYLHRTDRTGYKAGALEAGMKVAKGDFIAIFDADFIPTPDFLTRTVPFFVDPAIAMVQARWGHINQDYSLLTKIQSILLDGHFVLEHGGRNRAGYFFNFNGTAGIWRREAITDAGGWQHDTLTEDLDLSYRAQLRGGPDCAGGSSSRDELLQVAATPLGEGIGSDLPQAAAEDLAVIDAVRREGGGVLPPDRKLQLPAHVRAVGADGAGDGHSLQHGLVRDAADRRAALLRGDGIGGKLLSRLPA